MKSYPIAILSVLFFGPLGIIYTSSLMALVMTFVIVIFILAGALIDGQEILWTLWAICALINIAGVSHKNYYATKQQEHLAKQIAEAIEKKG